MKSTGMVNHYYFYCVAADFGPFFLKFCSSVPYNAKLCINGRHRAQRQAARAGLGFTALALDNAFARGRRSGRAAGDLRPAHHGTDRCAAAQVAGDAARSVHRRRPGR